MHLVIGDTDYALPGLNMGIALPYFVLLITVELVAAVWRYRTRKELLYRWNDTFSSLACGLTQQMTSKLAFALLLLYSYLFSYHYARLSSLDTFWMEHPFLLHSVAFLLVDHQYYWVHRFIHECSLGWWGHAPHHSSEEYNLSTALRQGMFQACFSWVFYVPLALLAIDPVTFALHSQINLLYQFWIHTKIIDRLPRIAEYVLNTPSHHRVHHGRNPRYIDKNYGGTLIVFDRLYGTFEPESEAVVYGLVHPLTTFNPIHTQFHHMVDMIRAARQFPRWKHKLQVFLRGPGFDPATQSFYPLPDVPPPQEVQLYDPKVPDSVKIFAFVQFIALFAIGLVYLESKPLVVAASTTAAVCSLWCHQLLINVLQYAYIFASVCICALMFERGAESMFRHEWWRHALLLVFIYGGRLLFEDEHIRYLLPTPFYTQQKQLHSTLPYGYSSLDYYKVFTVLSLLYCTVVGFYETRREKLQLQMARVTSPTVHSTSTSSSSSPNVMKASIDAEELVDQIALISKQKQIKVE